MPRGPILNTMVSVWILALITLSTPIYGNDNPLRLRRYSLNEGLSQASISALAQDQQGYLWIGTQDGLNRFDGYQFKVFRHQQNQPDSLSSDFIRDLYVDEDNVLWVATSKGLNRFNGDTETFTHFRLGQETREHIGSQYVDDIFPAGKDKLWVGTIDGLFLFDKNGKPPVSFRHDPKDTGSLGSNFIYDIFEDDDKKLWLGTQNGLYILDTNTGSFSSIKHDPDDQNTLSGNAITAVVKDIDGMMWVATYNSGLNRLDPNTGIIERFVHNKDDYYSIGHDRVRSLLLDKSGELWVGTRGGVSLYNRQENRFLNFRNDPVVATSLSNNHIWSMVEDSNNSIWFGTDDGINQFVKSTRKFGHNIKTSHSGIGISHKRVRSLYKDKDDVLWVGADNGLNRRDPKTGLYQYYQHDVNDSSTITKGMVMSILRDSKGRIWAGTYDGGLNLLLENGKFIQYTPDKENPNSISSRRVYSIMEDSQGYLWLGTIEGLNRFDTETGLFRHFYNNPNDPKSISQHSIYDTIEDVSGDIWVATRNGGLNRLDPKTGHFEHFTHDPNDPQSLSHNRIFALYQDNPDELWAATSNGLNRLDIQSGKFTRYDKRHGLLNNTVYAVTGDEQGYIWVSTNRGLARFNTTKERFQTFRFMDGLQSDEFNNGAYSKSHDGELLFGGINGFNRFYPDQIQPDTQPPPIAIDQFYLANKWPGLISSNPTSPLSKVINQLEQLVLSHRDAVFSFGFTALHFVDPDKNQYAYRLDGFDQDWTFTAADHRRATYTNLPAGEYVFRVKAANNHGIWNDTGRQMSIVIEPAPWQTLWAYLLYTMIVCSTIGAFAYQRWQKQTAIAASENRLSLSLWSSGNEFWDWNIKTGQLMRSSNQNTFHMPCGPHFSLERLKAAVHPDDYAALSLAFDQHVHGKSEYYECTYRIKDLNGHWIWVLDKGQIIERNAQGQAVRALGTVRNIDDLKMIEAELRALNEDLEDRVEQRTQELADTVDSLESANFNLRQTQEKLIEAEKMAALAGLVTGVAHELNTPLGICITSQSVLSSAGEQFFQLQVDKKLTVNDFEKFKLTVNETLCLLRSNLHKTAQLVQTFKMVSVDQSTDEAKLINAKQLFESVTTTFSEQLAQNNITVLVDSNSSAEIHTHSRSLELVFSQLIENSLLHGFAESAAGLISVTLFQDRENLVIEYQDNGAGVSQSDVDKLFEPFFTKARNKGHLGLGMHIMYNHINQRLGGSISFNKAVENGFALTITLPVNN